MLHRNHLIGYTIFAALACAALPASAAASAPSKGVVCVAPISADAVVDEMSGALRERVGKPLPAYSVRIDQGLLQRIDHHRFWRGGIGFASMPTENPPTASPFASPIAV